jgi:hypothetical protein
MNFLSRFNARFHLPVPAKHRKRSVGLSAFRPTLECLDARDVPSATTSSITSNFNGTAIPAGDTLWFSSVFKASGVGSNAVTLHVTDQTITFSAAGTDYTVPVPDSVINLSPGTSAANATTTFDTTQNAWVSNLPSSFSGNGFLSGTAFTLSSPLPGGINPVTWHASFSTDTPGVTLKWQWATAVYTSFGGTAAVKPLDGHTTAYPNSDHAGTPENFKSFVTGGARGGGGSNFTGSYSATASVIPGVGSEIAPAALSGYVYFDANQDGVYDTGDSALANVVITLTDANGNVVAQTFTDSNGFYFFNDLAVGTYSITETQPDGYDQGANNIGSLGGTLVDDTFTVTVGAGDNGVNYDFGEIHVLT